MGIFLAFIGGMMVGGVVGVLVMAMLSVVGDEDGDG